MKQLRKHILGLLALVLFAAPVFALDQGTVRQQFIDRGIEATIADRRAAQAVQGVADGNITERDVETIVSLLFGSSQTNNSPEYGNAVLSGIFDSGNPGENLSTVGTQLLSDGQRTESEINDLLNSPTALQDAFRNGTIDSNQAFSNSFPTVSAGGNSDGGGDSDAGGSQSSQTAADDVISTPRNYTRPAFNDPSRETNEGSASSDVVNAADPFVGHKESVKNYIKNDKFQSPLDEWTGGWASAYDGYSGNNSLFYTDNAEVNKYKYPQLRQQETAASWENSPASLEALNMTVDQEVLKTVMPIFRPIRGLQNDMSQDKNARNNFLDLYKSIRGISTLTLSYLDKTVGAGLATTDQAINSDVNNYFLKQINWATKEATDPRYEQLFSDVDEKVEACNLQINGELDQNKTLAERVCGGSNCKQMIDNCKDKGCGDEDPEDGKGAYAFCVCCAEVTNEANTGALDINKKKHWSLVDKVFFGYKGPDPDSAPSAAFGAQDKETAKKIVIETASQFKQLYGDYIFGKKEGGATNLSYRYIQPGLDIGQYIAILRDGCDGQVRGSGSGSNCPIGEKDTTRGFKGICPAIWDILKLMPINTDESRQKAEELWPEASMGKILTVSEINHWFVFSETKPPLPKGWGDLDYSTGERTNVNKKMVKFVESFCDAQAIAALKKIHDRMKGVVESHMTMNQTISEYQKAQIRSLYGRFDRQFQQVDGNKTSEMLVDEQLTLAAIQSDRGAQSDNAGNTYIGKQGVTTPFGNFGGSGLGLSNMTITEETTD